jgi:tetratricopeptide (TPR) repeat protein
MAEFDHDERPTSEADELMRQRRFADAATRYQDLRRREPTDLWIALAHVSALECAGDLDRAVQILDETVVRHRAAAPVHRFRRLFYVRREDMRAAQQSAAALEQDLFDEGPEDALAELYFNQGRYREAQAELQRLLRESGQEGEQRAGLLARLGACLRQLGSHDEAREHLLQALAHDREAAWSLAELAETERSLGEADAARRHYREALRLKPDDQWTRGHLAQLEHEQGETARSIALYEQILDEVPDAPWARVELAQVLTDRDGEDDRERAVALCTAALEIDPAYPWAHAHLGIMAKRGGDHAQARDHLLKARNAAPRSTWILHELADASRHAGHVKEAYALLDECEAIEPGEAANFGYRADFLRHDGRTDEAVANLLRAVDCDPNYAWAWRELAELHALAGRHDQAQEACDQAMALDPGAPVCDGLQAFLLRCKGDRAGALPLLERAIAKEPTYVWAWRERIENLLILGDAAAAETAATTAVGHLPDAQVLWGLLAECRRRRQDRQGALEALDKAAACGDLPAHLLGLRADMQASSGDHDTAIVTAKQAVTAGGGDDAVLLLGQVNANAGRHETALEVLAPLLASGHGAALELACLLHERRGDHAEALAVAERSLAAATAAGATGAGPAARLRVRIARLRKQLDLPIVAASLAVVFTVDPSHIPWRDAAMACIAAQDLQSARRAAWRAVEVAERDNDRSEQAQSWVCLAECELAGERPDVDAAAAAVAQAIARDAGLLPARVLAAVLAEQRDDLATAADHLAAIEQAMTADGRGIAGEPALIRQLASLSERAGRIDAAAGAWDRLAAARPDDAAVLADRAGFLLRNGRAKPLDPDVEAAAGGDPERAEVQRLWREQVAALIQQGQAKQAVGLLIGHAPHLSRTSRLLLVQVHLAAGDASAALNAAAILREELPPDDDLRPMATLMQARAALAAGDVESATTLARGRWTDELADVGTPDEDAAILLAECLLARGEPAEALAIIDHPRLSSRLSDERGLLGVCLALACEGPAAARGRLGRMGSVRTGPLVRVLAAAWPGTAAGDHDHPSRGDLRSVPPLPALVERLAEALAVAGRGELACDLMRLALVGWGSHSDPRSVALAVRLMRRHGRRGEALATAWRHGHVPALLRCCLPW